MLFHTCPTPLPLFDLSPIPSTSHQSLSLPLQPLPPSLIPSIFPSSASHQSTSPHSLPPSSPPPPSQLPGLPENDKLWIPGPMRMRDKGGGRWGEGRWELKGRGEESEGVSWPITYLNLPWSCVYVYRYVYIFFFCAWNSVRKLYLYNIHTFIHIYKKSHYSTLRVIRVYIFKIKNIYLLGPCCRCNGPRENYRELGRKTDGPRGWGKIPKKIKKRRLLKSFASKKCNISCETS